VPSEGCAISPKVNHQQRPWSRPLAGGGRRPGGGVRQVRRALRERATRPSPRSLLLREGGHTIECDRRDGSGRRDASPGRSRERGLRRSGMIAIVRRESGAGPERRGRRRQDEPRQCSRRHEVDRGSRRRGWRQERRRRLRLSRRRREDPRLDRRSRERCVGVCPRARGPATTCGRRRGHRLHRRGVAPPRSPVDPGPAPAPQPPAAVASPCAPRAQGRDRAA